MAGRVVERINVPLLDKLRAVRRTRDQVELTAGERRANVAARTSREPVARRLLLVDDVFTTGASLSECAGALRKASASEVHSLTLCRTF